MERIKVFVIDDSPIYREIMKNIIESDPDLEYVGFAVNGAAAVKKLDLINPDIITLDIEMPEMDGLQLKKLITELYEDTNIAFLTVHEEMMEEAFGKKVIGFIL